MSKDDFCRFIQNACPATTKDVVYIKLFLDEVRMNWKIKSDDTLTAMQKATAFSAVACASIVADGIDSESCVLTYANIPCEEMLRRMNRIELGIL